MARKSSKSIKPFELNFEVVLIIVLIIVAICLVCFLNRKYRGVEGFYTTQAGTTTAKDKDKKELHFFYADWCGYSTKYIKATSNGLEALKDALKDFIFNKTSHIYLFKKHYIDFKKIIDELYTLRIDASKKPKINEELFLLLKNNLKKI